jgi:hypothetical protein
MARDYDDNTVRKVFTTWSSLSLFKRKILGMKLIKPGPSNTKKSRESIRTSAKTVISMIKNDSRFFCYVVFFYFCYDNANANTNMINSPARLQL